MTLFMGLLLYIHYVYVDTQLGKYERYPAYELVLAKQICKDIWEKMRIWILMIIHVQYKQETAIPTDVYRKI